MKKIKLVGVNHKWDISKGMSYYKGLQCTKFNYAFFLYEVHQFGMTNEFYTSYLINTNMVGSIFLIYCIIYIGP
jgi:hypothetical protein